MPTNFERLASAYPLHLHRIVELIHANDPRNGDLFLASDSGSARWALHDAFDWRNSDEGGSYWYALADGARAVL